MEVIKEEYVEKEEPVLIGYCRLCTASKSDDDAMKLIDIDSDNVMKDLVVNMLNRLNTDIDFLRDELPRTFCSMCVQALYTAYDFVVGIDLAQTKLNKILEQEYINRTIENSKLSNNIEITSTCFQQVTPKIEVVEVTPNTEVLELHPSEAATNKQPPILNTPVPLSCDTPEEIRLKSKLEKKLEILRLGQQKIRYLNQTVRRLKNRNELLKSVVKTLKQKKFISTEEMNENMIVSDLYNNFSRRKLDKHLKYTKALKIFCLRLYHFSPKAYDYVRQSFDNCLPHRKTLSLWYKRIKDRVNKT